MQNGRPSDLLVRFVELVDRKHAKDGQALTVNDLRVEVRAERLTELSEWPSPDLEAIEQEAALYGDDASLTDLASGKLQFAAGADSQAVSWPDSPSPVAWT